MTLAMMPTAAVSECRWKELTTKGLRVRTTTSWIEVVK
jgi:hypothetical protein